MHTQKTRIVAIISGLFLGWAFFVHGVGVLTDYTVHAQAALPGAAKSDEVMTTIFLAIGTLVSLFEYIAYFVVAVMQVLVDPTLFVDMINGLGATNPLLDLWVVSRDIVNVILAFVLVAGAIMLVIRPGKRAELYPLAVKLVMAIVLVNFSWFFPRIVLDVANVLTATVYSIPADVFTSAPAGSPTSGCWSIEWDVSDPANPTSKAVNTCYIWNNFQHTPGGTPPAGSGPAGTAPKGSGASGAWQWDWQVLGNDANSPSAIFLGLVFNHANISNLAKVAANAKAGVGSRSLLHIIMATVFSLFMMIALLFPLVAMMVAFIIRIPVLWLTIAFMPFMFIGMVVGDKMKVGGQDFNTMYIWQKFLTAAFLPFVVAVPMVAGYLMLNAGIAAWWNNPPTSAIFLGAKQPSLFGINLQTIWQAMWMMVTFGVFWVGTFTALKVDSIYSGVSETIRGYGKSWGKLAVKAPFAAPILPIGKGGKWVSPLGVASKFGPRGLNQALDASVRKRMDDAFDDGKGIFRNASDVASDINARSDAPNIKQDIKNSFSNAHTEYTTLNAAAVNAGKTGNFTSPDLKEFNSKMLDLKDELKKHKLKFTYDNVKEFADKIGSDFATHLNNDADLNEIVKKWIDQNS